MLTVSIVPSTTYASVVDSSWTVRRNKAFAKGVFFVTYVPVTLEARIFCDKEKEKNFLDNGLQVYTKGKLFYSLQVFISKHAP